MFWSRDPDGTLHNQGDSLNQLTPGINGPTSLAAAISKESKTSAAARRAMPMYSQASPRRARPGEPGFAGRTVGLTDLPVGQTAHKE